MNKQGPGRIPDRWLGCPRRAFSLIGGKFMAFKVPLSYAFDDQVDTEYKFTPTMLLDLLKVHKIKVGLWIDLTNTTRFYDRREVESYNHLDGSGIRYIKIPCRGHGETPSEKQRSDFINTCNSFISQNPLKSIGVHCTHGFNRTGFLIVSFLVEVWDMSIDVALELFSKARPPGIYKADYLRELYKLYDEECNTPSPPPKPLWCIEYDDDDDPNDEDEESDDDFETVPDSVNGSSSSSKRSKRKNPQSNFSGENKRSRKSDKEIVFMKGVPGVTPVLDEDLLERLKKYTKQLTKFKINGFPGSQPVSINRENIQLLQKFPYTVSWKADGTRYMMLIVGEGQIYFIDRDNNYFHVQGVRFVHRKDLGKHLTETLLDGEMVIDVHQGVQYPRYLVYDIICCDKVNVGAMRYIPERELCIKTDIISPRQKAFDQGILIREREPFGVRQKAFFPIEKSSSILGEKFSKQLVHEPDGLIFQPSLDAYTPGTTPSVMKWKPPHLNSIDFRLKLAVESGVGIITKKIGMLFVGGMEKQFASMKYTSALKDLDNKIIECRFENGNWIYMRQRTDKSFPNSFKTAQAVWESIIHPVTKKYLLDFIDHYRYGIDRELMRPPPPRRS